MIHFVNAKINLGLKVVSRRADGYHNLDTVFLPVGKYSCTPGVPGQLCDILEITPAEQDSLEVIGADFRGSVENNLVWRAKEEFRRLVGELPPVAIRLEKHLPSGAGMGAGSADAAFTLLMLNELFGSCIPMDRLAKVAVSLGADVPFFLENRPCHATGIGEMLTPIEIPALDNKWITIVKPEESISTAQAFAGVIPSEPALPLMRALSEPIECWKRLISNDFEQSIFAHYPHLSQIKWQLYSQGALYASMSGSGSAFYGIFPNEESSRRAAESFSLPFVTYSALKM